MKEFKIEVCSCGKVRVKKRWFWVKRSFSDTIKEVIRKNKINEEGFIVCFVQKKCDDFFARQL